MTHAILVPGFWLDGASWAEVAAALEAHGYEVEAMTLPGKESRDADRSAVRLADHVAAVVARIDAAPEPVVLVGHSGGGSIVSGAADARPDRVSHAIYVDTGPHADGQVINDELPIEQHDLPFPGWEVLEEHELADMTPEVRERFEEMVVPEPAAVARDPLHVEHEERFAVPTTVIACSMPSVVLEQLMGDDHPFTRELARMHDHRIVDLPTGHWPQLTKPAELAEQIVGIVEGRGGAGEVVVGT
ncbi:MAG TPA: alpha/beta hydrolase [Actinotalea sp.]|nr:alpha/beta hydrolase [Actinotalea sp.]